MIRLHIPEVWYRVVDIEAETDEEAFHKYLNDPEAVAYEIDSEYEDEISPEQFPWFTQHFDSADFDDGKELIRYDRFPLKRKRL